MTVVEADLKLFPMSGSDFVVIYQGFRDGTWSVVHDEDDAVLTYDHEDADRVVMNYRHAGTRAAILPAALIKAGYRTDGELVLTDEATHAIPIEILSLSTGRNI
jgi:hypothetical protein